MAHPGRHVMLEENNRKTFRGGIPGQHFRWLASGVVSSSSNLAQGFCSLPKLFLTQFEGRRVSKLNKFDMDHFMQKYSYFQRLHPLFIATVNFFVCPMGIGTVT